MKTISMVTEPGCSVCMEQFLFSPTRNQTMVFLWHRTKIDMTLYQLFSKLARSILSDYKSKWFAP